MKIAIMGAGVYGTALGGVLEEKGYEVGYFDPMLAGTTVEGVLQGAEMVLIAVPSVALSGILAELPKEMPVIVATKGILSEEVFSGFTDVMVLSGPGFADEIKARKETYLTVTDKRLEEMFGVNFIKFDYTRDVRGVLMCGALKNVYALLAGYMGLLPGEEGYEQFIADVVEEMRGLLMVNGAEAGTVDLYCGVGDLRLTCDTPSRNYQYGAKLREDNKAQPETTVEGLTALSLIRDGAITVPETAVKLKELMEIIWG